MEILIVIPTQKELDSFLHSFAVQALQAKDSVIGRLPVVSFPDLSISLARGGLGKVQFAVQTQHLLDIHPGWDLVICTGAAGALVDELSIGDVVVSTETVEHDIHNMFGDPLLPRFSAPETVVADFRLVTPTPNSFQVHFGPVASGDEDVIDTERRRALHRLTGALVVAWEGAGGARACHFSKIPFIEIRGVTDRADQDAASDFDVNLESAMGNIADLITSWARGLIV